MKRNWLFVSLILLLSLFTFSCEIGLGSSVDVQVPTVGINYPELSSIVRGTFVVSGTCSDDTRIAGVTVKIFKADTDNKQLVGTYEAELSEDSTKWSVEINDFNLQEYPQTNGWQYADGIYEIQAYSTDIAKRKSPEASRSYNIDNTPPLMILSSPGIDDINNATSYGTTLKIKGNISDLNTASKLVLKVYEYDSATQGKGRLIGEYTETNLEKISDDGIVFAQKGSGDQKDTRYKELYPYHLGASGDKQYICEFTVSDNARLYRGLDSPESSNEGNSTSLFYFSDDVYNAWLNADAKLGYNDARKIISGLFTGDYVSTPIKTPTLVDGKIKRDNDNLTEHANGKAASDYVKDNLSVNQATFKLNKDANPHYSVSGYTYRLDASGLDLEVSSASTDSPVTIQAKAGLDGIFIEPKTMIAYMFGPFDNLTRDQLTEIYKNPAEYYTNNQDIALILKNNSDYASSSVENYALEFKVNGEISGGKYYVLAATGEDKNGNNLDPENFYAFKGSTNNAPPTFEWWTEPETTKNNIVYKNSVPNDGVVATSDLTFSGYVNSGSPLTDLSYIASITTEASRETVIRTIEGSLADGSIKLTKDETGKTIWTFDLKDGRDWFAANPDEEIVCSIALTASNGGDTTVSRIVHIDTKTPVVEIHGLSPEIQSTETTYLNGNIKISASISETNLKKVWYEIWSNGDLTASYKSPEYGELYNLNAIIDTTDVDKFKTTDNKTVNIIVYAEDKAGNKASHSIKEFNDNKAYTIDQSKDKPVITISNGGDATTTAAIDSFFDASGNNKLMGSVTDDDGIASLTVTVKKEDGTPVKTNEPVPFTRNTTSASINYQLPAEDGFYEISFDAVDTTYAEAATDEIKANRKSTWGPYFIGVDTKAPEVKITSHGTGKTTYDKTQMASGFDFVVNATDKNGIKEIVISAENTDNPEQEPKIWSSTNASEGEIVNNVWTKHFTKTDLPDGEYVFTATVTDYAGKTASAERQIEIDTIDPVLKSLVFNTPDKKLGENNSQNWYKKASVIATVEVAKDTSGVAAVQYSYTKAQNSWESFRKLSTAEDGTTTWTATIPCSIEGANRIYVQVVDNVGNITPDDSTVVYVDTIAPELTLEALSTFDTLGTENPVDFSVWTGTKVVNNTVNNLCFTVNANDLTEGVTTPSGIEKVVITKIGNTEYTDDNVIPGIALLGESNKFNFNIEHEKLESGSVHVTVYDNLGNSTDKALFNLDSDITDPVIEIKSVTPIVISGSDKKLNGTINVSAVIQEMNLKYVWYDIKSNGALIYTSTKEASTSDVNISIDTTATYNDGTHGVNTIADGKSIEVIIHAEDKAGNFGERSTTAYNSNKEFIVDQSTDKPKFELTNVDKPNSESKPQNPYPNSETQVNSFFDTIANKQISGTVTDDDGISELKVTLNKIVDDETQTPVSDYVDRVLSTPNSTTAQVNFILPEDAEDGFYTVTFTATDKTWNDSLPADIKALRQTVLGPFVIGVDNQAPEVTEEHATTGETVYTNKGITLKGTAWDNSGLRSLKLSSDKADKTGKKEWIWTPETADANTNTLTFDPATKIWTKTISKDEFADGRYKFTITATDKAKKTNSVDCYFVFDIKPPELLATVSNTAVVIDNNGVSQNWYGTSQITVTANTKEAVGGSGIDTVEYTTESGDGANWHPFTSAGTDEYGYSLWNGTANLTTQGENSIRVRAKDKTENISTLENPITVYIDTRAPATCELVSVDGDNSFSGKKYVNGDNDVTFIVTSAESGGVSGTGLEGIILTRIGNTTLNISGEVKDSTKPREYSITIPKAELSSGAGAVFVQATDKVGNENQEVSLFQIAYDNTAPEITITSVSPNVIVESKDAQGNDVTTKYLNGTVSISANISDDNLKNIWYEIYSDNTKIYTSANLGAKANFKEDIDTTAIFNDGVLGDKSIADEKSLKVIIYAEDEAGNSFWTDTTKYNADNAYIVDQEKDKPQITPSNFEMKASADAMTVSEWYAGGAKLSGSVSDDDGLESVNIIIDGTSTPIRIPANTTGAQINHNLPATDGIYKVEIVATDKTYSAATEAYKQYRTISTGEFYIGVDTKAPVTKITSHGTGTNTIGKADLVNNAFTLSGTAEDANGVNVSIKAVKEGDEDNPKTIDNISVDSDNKWSHEFTAGTGKDLADGTWTITVTATDPAGKTHSTDRTFIIDTTDPTLNAQITQTGGKDIGEGASKVTWYGTSQISVQATTSDGTSGSGVTTVEYSTDNTNWNSFTKGSTSAGTTTWTASVSCGSQGENSIYVRATDAAKNTSSLDSPITVHIDTKEPVKCDLISVNGDTEFRGTKLVNGKNDVTFVVKPSDYDTEGNGTYTGIASVTAIRIGVGSDWTAAQQNNTKGTPVSDTGNEGQYSITIPKELLTVSGSVYVKVVDNVGKEAVFPTFMIDSDVEKPTIKITDVIDKVPSTTNVIDVNQTVEVTGSASDTRELAKADIYYAIAASCPAVPADDDKGDSSKWTGWTKTTFIKSEAYSWSLSIPTGKDDDGKNIYIYAVAIDSAENVSFASKGIEKPVKVNQDSDRPVLNLLNLELSSSTAVDAEKSSYWHKINQLYGTVTDDDGTVKSVQYKLKSTDSWSENIYAGGMWTIENLSGGRQNIYFKVTDAENRSFESNAASTSYNTYGPKINDNTKTPSLGYSESADNIIKITVDTDDPRFEDDEPQAYVSSSETLAANPEWKNLSDDLFTVVGGTNKYLFLKVVSSDKNGIAEIKTTLNRKESSAASEIAKEISAVSGTSGSGDRLKQTKTVIVRFNLEKVGNNEADKTTASGLKKLDIKATDNAGKSVTKTYDINIDNTAPEVKFTTKGGINIYGSVANTIQGTTSDTHEITSLRYAVTVSETAIDLTDSSAVAAAKPADNVFKNIEYSIPEENQISVQNWAIHFDGRTTNQNEFHEGYMSVLYQNLMNKSQDDIDKDDTTKYMYLWLYAEDECGNISEPVVIQSNVLLNGDKPSVEITYPDDGRSVGGTIRITGTSSIATSNVKAVYVQLDAGYNDTSFDSNWLTKNSGLINNKYTVDTVYKDADETIAISAPYNKGIKADGTISWSLNANRTNEFDELSNNEKIKVAIRVFAVSDTGKVSDPVIHVITIDPDAPRIGDTNPLKLVQYETSAGSGIPCTDGSVSSGNIAAEQVYDLTKGFIDLKGIWYLTGSLEDQSGISYIKVTESGNTPVEVLKDGTLLPNYVIKDTNPSESNPSCYNYNLNLRVGDDTDDSFGSKTYSIDIQDGSENHNPNQVSIKVNFDNKAPEFDVTSSSSGLAGTAEFKQIYQNNGTYTLAGTYNETGSAATQASQSGFERIVMFYTRTYGGDTYLIDPMLTSGTTGIANREVVGLYTPGSEGLYWRTAEGKVANNTLTVSKFKGSAFNASTNPLVPYVRAGGLVKVNNVIYRIKSVNGNSVVIDGSVKDIDSTTAVYFAAATLVIDNTVSETGTTGIYVPANTNANTGKDTMANGDGDQMQESVNTANNMDYTWTVSIDSTNILDGDVDLHFIAFDKAGNATPKTITGAKVANNAPRLAGVKYGTDTNGNSIVEEDELKTEYSNIYANVRQISSAIGATANGMRADGTKVTEIEIDTSDRLVVKGAMKVIPQIVGGNIGLGWKYKYKTAASGNATKETGVTYYTGEGAQHSSDGSIRNGEDGSKDSVYAIDISTLDFFSLDNKNGIMNGEQELEFVVIDETEGGSLSATIKLPVNIVFTDNTPPEAVFQPFYWRGKTANSLYNNSKDNGHIELEADLPPAFTDGGAEEKDRDPKVSGIISMDGIAQDNVLVKTIVININGTAYTVATRGDDGNWTSGTNNANLLVLRKADAEKNITALTYDDYKFTGAGSQNWYFELVSDEFDSITGENTVNFRFHWNTAAMITEVAAADVPVTVTATDRGSIGWNSEKTELTYTAGKSSTPGNAQTTSANNTGYYKMDVVPYITGIKTFLSKYKANNPSVYNRTALGHYPVRAAVKNSDKLHDNSNEVVTITGFNLTGGNASISLSTENLDSGNYAVKTNGIDSLNNKNNNDVDYNSQGNGDNNDSLKDDVIFDVWEINDRAVKSISNGIKNPVMNINPYNGQIGFAFTSANYYSMPTLNDSFMYWVASNDALNNSMFTYHSSGNTSGIVSGNSIIENEDFRKVDNMLLYMDRLGTGQKAKTGTFSGIGGYRIDKITQKGSAVKGKVYSPAMITYGDNLYTAYYDSINKEIRFKNGVIDNTKFGSTNYDNGVSVRVNGSVDWKVLGFSLVSSRPASIIFAAEKGQNVIQYKRNYVKTSEMYHTKYASGKYIKVKDKYYQIESVTTEETFEGDNGIIRAYTDTVTLTTNLQDAISELTSDKSANANDDLWKVYSLVPPQFGSYRDQFTQVDQDDQDYDDSTVQIISTVDDVSTAGPYVSMDVDPSGKVVVTWFNENDKSLYYAYSENPSEIDGEKPNATWTVKQLRSNAGEYCKVKADADGGIHITCFEYGTGDILYLYMPAYDGTPVESVVDTDEVKSFNLSLDVVKPSADAQPVPYISWYCAAIAQPRMAYLVNTSIYNNTRSVADGMINGKYTGNWEITVIPTVNDVQRDNVNVALWKNAGVQKKSDTGTSTWTHIEDAEKSTSYGVVYGNGTVNPVMGYVTSDGTKGYIETAQMR